MNSPTTMCSVHVKYKNIIKVDKKMQLSMSIPYLRFQQNHYCFCHSVMVLNPYFVEHDHNQYYLTSSLRKKNLYNSLLSKINETQLLAGLPL